MTSLADIVCVYVLSCPALKLGHGSEYILGMRLNTDKNI